MTKSSCPPITFVSTANAFVLRGAVPVFVDIREDTLNIDETLIEAAITPRTKAICVVHYAGVACEMDAILAIARRHGIAVVEDAAQGIYSTLQGTPAGRDWRAGLPQLPRNQEHHLRRRRRAARHAMRRLAERAEIIREKGTNRSRFFRGQVDKYTWVDIGSSYLPSEIIAAFLAAQMDAGEEITATAAGALESVPRLGGEARGGRHSAATRCTGPLRPQCPHVLPAAAQPGTAHRVHPALKERGVGTVFHYIPAAFLPCRLRFGRAHGALPVTDNISDRLVRMPLWVGLEDHMDECSQPPTKSCATWAETQLP